MEQRSLYQQFLGLPTEQLDALLQRNAKTFNQLNEAIFADDFTIVQSIYTDLQAIKDTRLGLLLAISTPEQMQYIHDHLDAYNRRPDRLFLSEFPDLPYREDELEVMYGDPTLTDKIFNVSPDTTISQQVVYIINQLTAKNKLANYNEPISLTINVYPLKHTQLIEEYRRAWQLYLSAIKTKVTIVSIDPLTIPNAVWNTYRFIILDRFIELIQPNTPFYTAFFEHKTFLDTYITTHPAIDPKIKQRMDEQELPYKKALPELAELTYLVLQFYCKFNYTFFQVLSSKECCSLHSQRECYSLHSQRA